MANQSKNKDEDLRAVGVPDEDPVVLAAGEEEVAVVLAPGHAQHPFVVSLQGLQGARGKSEQQATAVFRFFMVFRDLPT